MSEQVYYDSKRTKNGTYSAYVYKWDDAGMNEITLYNSMGGYTNAEAAGVARCGDEVDAAADEGGGRGRGGDDAGRTCKGEDRAGSRGADADVAGIAYPDARISG